MLESCRRSRRGKAYLAILLDGLITATKRYEECQDGRDVGGYRLYL